MDTSQDVAKLGTGVWEVDSDRVAWSEQAHRILGIDPMYGPPTFEQFVDMIDPQDRERVLSVLRSAQQSGGGYEVEYRVVRSDGRVVEIHGTGQAERDETGRVVRLIGGVQDVSIARAVGRELQHSRDLFAGVLDAATEQSIIACDPEGLITVFNSGAERMLGYRAAEMIGTSPERLHDPDEMAARAAELGVQPGYGVFLELPARGRPEIRRWTYLTADGRRLIASITVSAMHGPCGRVTGFIEVGTDITQQVSAEVALEESDLLFRNMFHYAPNGIMLFGIGNDNLGRFLQVNPALARLTGYSQDQLLGMRMGDLVAPDDLRGHQERLAAFHENPVLGGAVERHWMTADGQDLWVQINLSPGSSTADGAYVVGQVEDITARKRAEAALRHQALHDGLTGLPNRVLLMDRIEHALTVSARSDREIAVLYMDLDGFKAVNDSAGHAAGDQALVHAADQTQAVLRPADTVARLGGDEFVVVCEGLRSVQEAVTIAERILDAVSAPFIHGGQTFHLTCSIGISVSTPTSRPEQLLQHADQAMYDAKRTGKARVQVGMLEDPAHLARSAQEARAVRISAELQEALDRDELIVHGQPVLNLDTGEVVAVETLIRWQHPIAGLLAPGAFLDVAEAGDLILPIGRRALQESCRMAARWVEMCGPDAPSVHVNVSGRQLGFGDLHFEVVQALEKYHLDPSQLVLELTETYMPLIANSLKVDLENLRDRGVKVAIDDLGTGYSSLSRITQLPVDILKIDLSFVADMQNDPACAAVVRGILAIGDALGLDVIAEGVETVSQADQLRDYGCTTVQGFLYSRPLPEPELHEHLATHPVGKASISRRCAGR